MKTAIESQLVGRREEEVKEVVVQEKRRYTANPILRDAKNPNSTPSAPQRY
jgi:hypothetical protein